MINPLLRFGPLVIASTLLAAGRPALADEIWVAPTLQADLGGLGVASNTIWPVTPVGATRLAWGVPNNLQTFQRAKVVLIPQAPGGAATLNVLVCAAQDGSMAGANCAGPFTQTFTGMANQLTEVEIGSLISSHIGVAGANYLAVLAYTTPTTTTDHIVGLRFSFVPKVPPGVATLGANTFTGTQTAPAFVGNGSGLTGLPFPAGAATLGSNVFSGPQTAPAYAGSGASLTGVAKLAMNTFSGTQTINTGNLDLDASTATSGNITKDGVPFMHDTGPFGTFLGLNAGNLAITGNANTAVGNQALMSNTTGVANVAYGYRALRNNLTGGFNTAIGPFALSNSTGGNNVAIGYNAGLGNFGGQNNIYLGEFSGPVGENIESHSIYVGLQGSHTKTIIAGIRGITTGVANAVPVVIDSNGQLGTASSSIRFKEDVHDMGGASRRLLQLRPVTFRYTQAYNDGAKPIQYGLVAEEVADVFPELAVRGADGQVETVHYEALNVLLLNEVQQQQQRIDMLEQRLDQLVRAR
jgi:hypothetical protein